MKSTVFRTLLTFLGTGMLLATILIIVAQSDPRRLVETVNIRRDNYPLTEPWQPQANWWPTFHHDPRRTGFTQSNLKPPLSLKWNVTVAEYAGYGSPVVSEGYLYFGAYNQLYALDACSGGVRWNYTTDDWILCAPTVHEGIIYCGSDKIYAVNGSDGSLIWSYDTGITRSACSPAVAYGMVYSTDVAAKMLALNASTGELVWTFTSQNDFYRSSPAVDNGVVYVGCYDYNVYALDAYNGSVVWSSNVSGFVESTPTVADGVVYIGAQVGGHALQPLGTFFALNASDGTQLWNHTFLCSFYENSPSIMDGVVYMGNPDGYVYSFNSSTGALVWKSAQIGPIYSSPAISNGTVYIGTQDNTIVGLNATNGETVWIFGTEGIVRNSPAIAGDMLFFASADHTMYAVQSGTRDIMLLGVVTRKTGCQPMPTLGEGWNLPINITVQNLGDSAETFNLTIYANSTLVAEKSVILLSGESAIETSTFNSTGFPYGNCTILAYAEPVPDEADTTNNVAIDWIIVTIPGDINGDRLVDIFDAISLAGSICHAGLNPNADINNDSMIDIFDAIIVAGRFGESW